MTEIIKQSAACNPSWLHKTKKPLELIKNASSLIIANLDQNLYHKPTMIKMSRKPLLPQNLHQKNHNLKTRQLNARCLLNNSYGHKSQKTLITLWLSWSALGSGIGLYLSRFKALSFNSFGCTCFSSYTF